MTGDIASIHRTRLAKETGTVRKDWGGRLSVCLVYPNHYRLGISNLGFQVVYHLLNQRPDVVAERVFLPEGLEMSLHLQSGKPLLSLESQSPLERFDLIAFSVSFENDYLNVLEILTLGRIPLLPQERASSCPYVMAGGVATALNPEPLASFVDFFLLGEAEVNLGPFLDLFMDFRAKNRSRQESLGDLAAHCPGLYVPSLYRPEYNADGTLKSLVPLHQGIPERVRVPRIPLSGFSALPVAASTITAPDTTFGDKVLVEMGRGCGRSCRFCAAGYVYRPPRAHPESRLREALQAAWQTHKAFGLLGASLSDVPGIEGLMALLLDRGCSFSLSSLRMDAMNETLLDLLKGSGQKTLSMAPEAGSERLRRVINKHLTQEQMIETVRLISRKGDFSLRLYFLMGLPTETREDVKALVDLAKTLKHHMVKESSPRGHIRQIHLSVNCFVPKALTPFQWLPMESVNSLKEKQKSVAKALAREGGFRVNFDIPKWAFVQALLSLGDRRVGKILLLAHQNGGHWMQAFRLSDINPDFFVYRQKELDEVLPWDHLDHGLRKSHLIREYTLALKGEESEPCLVGQCFRCGACNDWP